MMVPLRSSPHRCDRWRCPVGRLSVVVVPEPDADNTPDMSVTGADRQGSVFSKAFLA